MCVQNVQRTYKFNNKETPRKLQMKNQMAKKYLKNFPISPGIREIKSKFFPNCYQ